MTKRLKLFLTILLGAIAIACLAAGCKVGQPGREEVLAPYKGGHVTYYANGGYFDKNTAITVRELYFKNSGSPFFDVTEETSGISIMRSGYDFVGWYLPARYESGEHEGEIKYTYTYKENGEDKTVPAYPKLNEDGTVATDKVEVRPLFYIEGSQADILEKQISVIPSETAVDASRILEDEENLVVCANWKPALKFVFKLAAQQAVSDGKTYKHGDVISTTAFGKGLVANPGETVSVSFDNMTFVANYKDEACTQYVTDYNRADYEGKEEIVIWSRFIDGYWTVVKNNPNKVKDMFSGLNKATNRYYLLEDVDCSTITTFNMSMGVRAEIEGNGHTLKNLKFKPGTPVGSGLSVAPVFGSIYSTAKIKNLTLSNITISLKGKADLTFYAICKSVDDGATITNLTIDGVTAEVSKPPEYNVSNVQGEDRSNWLFGGKGTDEAFATAYGITVTGTNTLTIK